MTAQSLLERRSRTLAPTYRLFYDEPVHLVRGDGVWVWDEKGTRLLDCYNNVPSVGHCHPRVVEAIARQASQLNTNSRYLHETVVRLAERLGEKLPGDLSTAIFVCTGSEAVDLAVRIARAVTGMRGVVVNEASYHGNTTLVHELSLGAYAEGEQAPDWLAAAEPPNTYRGTFRKGEPYLGAGYAALVDEASAELDERGHGIAAFLVDSTWDSHGFLNAPPDYLTLAARAVRARGGLVVADEVQAGYCRTGDSWWGFEDYDTVPDIVVLGKPMGGGHPVGAVITTPEIAAEFGASHSYFNTFGGNPVSAAAALAVLDVIDDESLLDNVTTVGSYLGAGLVELAGRHDVIGKVHGKGLFWGVELVLDRHTREPVSEGRTERLVTELRRAGVLMGVTGKHHNGIKIRPPLVFSAGDADLALESLDDCLTSFDWLA